MWELFSKGFAVVLVMFIAVMLIREMLTDKRTDNH